eukprot:SAG31_NODE_4045_length_3640_cov_3.520474_4_plen_69_part_00
MLPAQDIDRADTVNTRPPLNESDPPTVNNVGHPAEIRRGGQDAGGALQDRRRQRRQLIRDYAARERTD